MTLLVLAASGTVSGQQVALAVGSGSAAPGTSITVPITLTISGGALPAGLQWTMGYSASDISGVTVTAGSSATAASKTVTCLSASSTTTNCVAYGVNTNILSGGTLASATFTIASGSLDASTAIQMSGLMATDAMGDLNTISASGTGGTITIPQPVGPTLGGLACTPTTVSAAGVSACTVTLSGAAPTGGFAVGVSSNNSNMTVPASVTVGSGATSAGFSATASGTISSAQTAVLTATAAGVSKTFSLNLLAATWSITGSVGAAGSGATIMLTGTSTATTTANVSGSYTFSGLANGSYTVTPSLSGHTFSPASAAVTVNGANATAAAFTATQSVPSSITFVQSTSASQVSGATASKAFSSSVTVGDLIIVGVFVDVGATVSVKDVLGATFTQIAHQTVASDHDADVFVGTAGSSGADTITINAGSSKNVYAFSIHEYRGVTATVDASATAQGNSTAPASGSLTTITPNDLIFAWFTNGSNFRNENFSALNSAYTKREMSGSGTTQCYTFANCVESGDQVAATILTTNATATLNVADIWSATAIAFRGASAGSQKTGLVRPAAVPMTTGATSQNVSAAPLALAPLALATIGTGKAGEACSPGGLASLLGAGLTGAPTERSTSQPLPTQLAGVQVLVNSVPAPLLLASSSQINFQCPVLTQGTTMQIQVESANGALTAPLQTVMQAAAPVLFQMDGSGRGLVTIAGTDEIAMAKTDGIPSRPALPGESLTIHASGLGEVVDGVAAGTAAPLHRLVPTKMQIKLVLGDIEIDPGFAGLAPGTVGVYQVNAQVPSAAPAGGSVPLYLKMTLADGTIVRSNTVTMAIGEGGQ
jgi:uncharacterized protein (TIGR03437 family)